MPSTTPIKTLLVDDEAAARALLADLLQQDADIAIVAQAGNATEALAAIAAHKPELIFLDIEMPDQNGLHLAQELRSMQLDCHIVFVTAFNHYAIEAFETAAFDYLLKPIIPGRLHKTLSRLKADRHTKDLSQRLELLSCCLAPENIRFATKTGFTMLDPRDILYAEADGNYTTLHLTHQEKTLVSMQLGRVESLLPASLFIRINRSALVNRRYISSFNRVARSLHMFHQGKVHVFKVSREALRLLKEMP